MLVVTFVLDKSCVSKLDRSINIDLQLPKVGTCIKLEAFMLGGEVAHLVRASDRHTADAGSISQCGRGFFSQCQLSVQTFLRVLVHPRVQLHALASVHTLKIL